MWPESTAAFGTEMSSFFGVRIRVTKKLFSTTSPNVSPTLTRSPIRNAREYVSTIPATMFAIAVEDPSENRMPRKTVSPWNTGLSTIGVYG